MTQFFCLERKRLVHLSIEEDMVSRIPKFNWSDPVHKIIEAHAVPADHAAADAHIFWVDPMHDDITHQEYLQASTAWALETYNRALGTEDPLPVVADAFAAAERRLRSNEGH